MSSTIDTSPLEVRCHINAPAEKVWDIVSDIRGTGKWNSQSKKILVLGATVGPRTRMFNLNSAGKFLWWPTSSVITEFLPNKRLAIRISENRSVWSYDLIEENGGTTLVNTRTVPAEGTSKYSQFLANTFFGSDDNFRTLLLEGMNRTVNAVKAAAEQQA